MPPVPLVTDPSAHDPRRVDRMLTALLVVAGATCLLGEYLHVPALVYCGKPLATIATIVIAARSANAASAGYRAWITAGLACSLAGDVFLMLPQDLFVAGLASFLVAHLLYIVAFVRHGGRARDTTAVGVFGFAALMLLLIWPALGALRWPVVAYVAVIATMAWQALARWRHIRTGDAQLAAIGALVFLCSDSALAVRKFHGEFAGSVVVVLGTYWVAQWCIATSVTVRRTSPTG
jgi:uncharacterized membrane protein YhhN